MILLSNENEVNKSSEELSAVYYSDESLAALRGSDGNGAVDLSSIRGISGYAELFETIDGKAIDCGYFVTLDGSKIKVANSKDRYILGITALSPAVLGANSDVRWKGKYVTDQWGKIQYDEVDVPAVINEAGIIIIPEHKEKQPRINPLWDKSREYIPRTLRPEWASVTLIGQAIVRDDGTCEVNGYCVPNDSGIATTAQRGYRVMARRTPNQILVLLRSNTINLGSK